MESASIVSLGVQKDYCSHFLAGGKEGTPEAFFCRSCGCHLCFHEKEVEKVPVDTLYLTGRSAATVNYGECVKNHALQTGGSWVDGCGEFVAAGEEGTPEALSVAEAHEITGGICPQLILKIPYKNQ
ncbi:hypothetical protein YC2023_119392 [Brassica napus]